MTPDETISGLNADLADKPIINVLFLCDDNSCRSPIAEALLNFAGKGRFWAFSAGFMSAKEIDPIAIELMRKAGIPCGGLRPKKWRGFTTPNAPCIDIVVCLDTHLPLSDAAGILPGDPIIINWPTENTVNIKGSQANRRSACERMLRELEGRVLKLAGSAATTPYDKPDQALLTEAA